MTFDPALPVQTRDGRRVTILCTNKRGRCPIAGLIHDEDEDLMVAWWEDGLLTHHGAKTPLDLINVEP